MSLLLFVLFYFLCDLFFVFCSLSLLVVVRCWLFVARCLDSVVCSSLFVLGCWFSCSLFVSWLLLVVARCLCLVVVVCC